MFEGWIIAPLSDKFELEKLGITLGEYSSVEHCFRDCKVKDLKVLENHWGRWFWSLQRKRHGKKNKH